jgi:hypothetical protein
MLNFIVGTLILIEVAMIFLRFTKMGRILFLIFKTMYKIINEVLRINYSFLKSLHKSIKSINKKHKQSKVRELKKAVGCENIIDLMKYKKDKKGV